jgi:hypothetical protein
MFRSSAILAMFLVGCSGADTPKPTPPTPAPDDGGGDGDGGDLSRPNPRPQDITKPPPDVVKPDPIVDHKPEVFAPPWTKVGVGQTIHFSVAAIDQDLEETRVDVTAKPESATFDALTQTVSWTPTKADLATGGTFVLRIDQAATPGGAWTKTETQTFTIAVDAKKQKAPQPATQTPTVETLITIREPARLTNVNLDWPLDKMLVTGAELFRATLPPEVQTKLAKVNRTDAYKSFLKGLAQTHDNPRLDPDSPQFDKAAFATPESWKIVAVRPRIDKKWNELRIVYQAMDAAEPVFGMFRLRTTWDVPTLPPEARGVNNATFAGLVAKHLLDKELAPNAKLATDKKAHAKAVAAFVKAVVTYAPPAPKKGEAAPPPWQRAAFVALPTEARMGGGSARDAAGAYRSGDGWAWGVMKPMASADGSTQAYVNIGIPGFWTLAEPSADGKAWAPKCSPEFDPDNPKHKAGFEVLCRKAMGFVDLPDEHDGKIVSSKRDAVNLFVEHKLGDAVKHLPLADGRRDLGEENGMTCAQCHIRNFGMRDYADASTTDPSAGAPKVANHAIATLNFQIIPSVSNPRWEDFTLEFMQDQECRGKASLEAALGKPTGLTCPLAPK